MTSAIAQLQPHRPGSPDPALLTAAVEAFPESLAIIASGLVVYANPAWCQMFECDPSQILGQPVGDFIPAHSLCSEPISAVHEERDTGPDTQFVHTRRDGARLDIELGRTRFHLRGRDFQVIHPRDISRQKQMETRLQEAQTLEAVGRLVGGVAHDFNNLLTGIMLYCDLLMAELEKDSRPRRHAEEMRMAGEYGAALVHQLLGVARPPAEEPRVFALNGVIASLEDLLTRLMGENIILSTSLAADLGAVRMDPAQVQQILLNLLLNARDAMPDGGRITLATRNFTEHLPGPESISQTVSWVELSVSDTGSGMDAETLGRAFEPFFTTKEPGRGSGLGLATARWLARQEGGTIVAESQPGKGTRVSVRLPRVQAAASSNSKAEVKS